MRGFVQARVPHRISKSGKWPGGAAKAMTDGRLGMRGTGSMTDPSEDGGGDRVMKAGDRNGGDRPDR